jgi:hypothetical protein
MQRQNPALHAVAVIAASLLSFLQAPAANAARTTTEGVWVGQGHAVRTASLGLVTITCRYDSLFWFVVKASGAVEGQATVSYDLAFNDTRLRSLIGHANWAGNAAIGMIPGIGNLLGAGVATRDVLGMRMQYSEPAPVRHGRITGQASNGSLHLQWAVAPAPIAYHKYVVYPLKDKLLSTDTHPAYQPWIGDAAIVEPEPGRLVALTSAESSRQQKSGIAISAIWSAEKKP